MKAYYVYMMTNRSRVVLYTGVTNSLECRLWFHRDAISREKEINGWRREKKNDLVRRLNPKWEDLGENLFSDHW
jgi:putative endonuclease